MQGCTSGSAQRLRRKRVCGAADAGGGGGGAGCAKSGSGAQYRAYIAGILHTGKDDQQRSTGRMRAAHEIIEGGLSRMNQRGDSLRMLGVGEALEEAVCGTEDGKSHFGTVDGGREALVMAFPEFAEEHALHAAPGTQCLFDESDAFDANKAVFRGHAAAQCHAEFLEPAIVAAGEERRVVRGTSIASGFAWTCHHRGA